MKNKLVSALVCGACLLGLGATACADSVDFVDTDKAMYSPNETIKVVSKFTSESDRQGYYKVILKNPVSDSSDGYAYKQISDGTWHIDSGNSVVMAEGGLDIKAPKDDGRGYILTVQFYNYDHKLLAEKSSAVDVSSKWTMFPRYAALGQWNQDLNDQNKGIEELKKLHINATMYYDAYYRPQNPFPSDIFKDWLGNTISQNNIKNAIDQNHKYGQSALFYDMINATTGNPDDSDSAMADGDFRAITKKDGTRSVESPWGIYRLNDVDTGLVTKDAVGEQKSFNMLSSFDNRGSADMQVQSYYNLWSKDWQNYIGNKLWDALTYMGFDGWQGDTIGNDTVVTYEHRYDKKDSFPVVSGFYNFVESMKNNQMKNFDFGINAVGGLGQKDLDKSKADFMYSEIWSNNDTDDNTAPGNTNGTHTTYDALARSVDNTMQNSGKSLIVPAYMYHDYHPEWMSDKAILLKDISVLASGGDNMELVDGVNEIYSEYYTGVLKDKKSKLSTAMSDSDNGKLRKLYDFQVAYENFLRGGNLQKNHHKIEVTQNGQNVGSENGEANKIWYMTKSGHGNKIDDAETINLINLKDVNHIGWDIKDQSDDDKKQVNTQHDVHVKYYVDPGRDIKNIWIASPDSWLNGDNNKLDFSKGHDDNGDFVEFDVPELNYWDLIYMK